MVYAVNEKSSCYTGFTQVKTQGKGFDYKDFLASQALPGPNSIITCIIQPYGIRGPTQYMVLEKKTPLS